MSYVYLPTCESREIFCIFAENTNIMADRYVYVVDMEWIFSVFSNRRKANAYVDSMLETKKDLGWRVRIDDKKEFINVLRYVEITKRGRDNGTEKWRIVRTPLE